VKPLFLDGVDGELVIWHEPEPGAQYAIGVDSSEGVPGGDLAAAYVVEIQSMAMCARWRGLIDPNQWAIDTCLLGHAYNQAFICYETGGSAHGLTTANSAMLLGYPMLYRRIHQDQVERTTTKKLGFRTDRRTRPMLFNRVRVALQEEYEINCPILLRELVAVKLEGGEIVSDEHDDCVLAYALTLEARDAGYTSGLFKERPVEQSLTAEDRMWNEWDQEDGVEERAVFGTHRRLRRKRGEAQTEDRDDGAQRGRGDRGGLRRPGRR